MQPPLASGMAWQWIGPVLLHLNNACDAYGEGDVALLALLAESRGQLLAVLAECMPGLVSGNHAAVAATDVPFPAMAAWHWHWRCCWLQGAASAVVGLHWPLGPVAAGQGPMTFGLHGLCLLRL